MDLFEVILTWRSVRTFTDEAISEEALDKVVRSAMAAANSGNQQPWRFVVIDDPALRDLICDLEI